VSGEWIDVTPEPSPAEAEAIRRALEALGLVEPAGTDAAADTGSDPVRSA
jgi:hypothetical protein